MRFPGTLRGLTVLTMAGVSLTAVLLIAVPVLTLVTRQATLDALGSDTFTYGDLERFNGTSGDIGRLEELLAVAGTASFLLFVGWLYRARRRAATGLQRLGWLAVLAAV